MQRILSNEQMRIADKFTIENLGISSDELIERAGRAVAQVIKKRLLGGRVLVCMGKGNNGKDGKVIADNLSKMHGFTVNTLNVYNGIFKVFDNKFDVIVDCIFGTGLNRDVEGNYKKAIEKINQSGAYVVSCDIASGLNGDNGKVMGCAVKANLTVAIQELKLGHFLNDGPDYSGEVTSVDIGISIWGDDFVKKISPNSAIKLFPERNRNVNKGHFGKTCIIGGSLCYPGSILLSANAVSALKMGVGYCNLAVPGSLVQNYVCKTPECTFTPIKDENGFLCYDQDALGRLLKYNSIAIGMGLGTSEYVYKTICYLLSNYCGVLIIDADGLNSLAKFGVEVLKNAKCRVILTPHVGEFARLGGYNKEEIVSDGINLAKQFAHTYGVILVLKSATSIITDGEEMYLNTSGCSGMAKGGSGDVLSGFIAGVTARYNDPLFDAVVCAHLFGLAGEIAQKEHGSYCMLASDIINALPKAIKSLSN